MPTPKEIVEIRWNLSFFQIQSVVSLDSLGSIVKLMKGQAISVNLLIQPVRYFIYAYYYTIYFSWSSDKFSDIQSVYIFYFTWWAM